MICRTCGQDKIVSSDKEISQFYYNKATKKFFIDCKICSNIRSRKWDKEHREQKLEHRKRSNKKYSVERTAAAMKWAKENPGPRKKICSNWRWRIRLKIIEEYGGKCACCGESIPEFLTIDHIDGTGAEHRRKMGKGKTFAGAPNKV